MYSKREMAEFDIALEGYSRLRFTHLIDSGDICIQEVYPDGEETDDLLTIKTENLTDIINILKEIRGY